MRLASGTALGPYRIVSSIGAGGMGEVYRARDTRLNRDGAVKMLAAHLSGDAAALGRFVREAQAVAALSHPNIEGAIPLRKALDYAQHVASGLAAAHERGIVHRGARPHRGRPCRHLRARAPITVIVNWHRLSAMTAGR
jgi:serine/threonine protein kinase